MQKSARNTGRMFVIVSWKWCIWGTNISSLVGLRSMHRAMCITRNSSSWQISPLKSIQTLRLRLRECPWQSWSRRIQDSTSLRSFSHSNKKIPKATLRYTISPKSSSMLWKIILASKMSMLNLGNIDQMSPGKLWRISSLESSPLARWEVHGSNSWRNTNITWTTTTR